VTVLDSGAEGLRERKKAKTRRALIDAASDLFLRQGFERTTVEQIADACDVSPRTFFRYFATKEDVLFGDSADKYDMLVAALEARPAGESPLASLRAASLALVGSYATERDRLKARAEIVRSTPSLRVHGSERQDQWNETAVELLTGRRQGVDRSERPLDIRLVVAASSAAVHAAVQTWLLAPGADLVELVEQAFELLATGLERTGAT
jgi:AcrR family transcriptional regulator